MAASLKQLRTVTITEAVERLNVSDDSIRKWCGTGKVRYFRDGARGTYHIIEADLVRRVEQMLQGAQPEEGVSEREDAQIRHLDAFTDGHAQGHQKDSVGSNIEDLLPPVSERRFARGAR